MLFSTKQSLHREDWDDGRGKVNSGLQRCSISRLVCSPDVLATSPWFCISNSNPPVNKHRSVSIYLHYEIKALSCFSELTGSVFVDTWSSPNRMDRGLHSSISTQLLIVIKYLHTVLLLQSTEEKPSQSGRWRCPGRAQQEANCQVLDPSKQTVYSYSRTTSSWTQSAVHRTRQTWCTEQVKEIKIK